MGKVALVKTFALPVYSEIAKETKETQYYVDYMFIAILNRLVRQETISDYKFSKLDKRKPNLIYPLTVLNNPPADIINKIKSEIFRFIWDSKPDKVERLVFMQDY